MNVVLYIVTEPAYLVLYIVTEPAYLVLYIDINLDLWNAKRDAPYQMWLRISQWNKFLTTMKVDVLGCPLPSVCRCCASLFDHFHYNYSCSRKLCARGARWKVSRMKKTSTDTHFSCLELIATSTVMASNLPVLLDLSIILATTAPPPMLLTTNVHSSSVYSLPEPCTHGSHVCFF